MAGDSTDCESDQKTASAGWKVIPETTVSARAWVENEEPGENKQLLSPVKKPSQNAIVAIHGYKGKKPKVREVQKPNLQQKLGKLALLLKPPYFIVIMIFITVCIHFLVSEDFKLKVVWIPENWWTKPWTLVTYGFIHANASHLAINALMALVVGWCLEREQGWWRMAVLWCGGVVSGALGCGALQQHVRVVGSSAAVYTFLTAHLANVAYRYGHISLWWFRPLSVLVLGVSEGFWELFQMKNTAWAAHALGAAAGIPIGFIIFTGENKAHHYVVIARIVSGMVLLLGVMMAVIHYTHLTERHHR